MNDESLRRNLIEIALAAELHHLARLPEDFHASDPQHRGEMAAWVVQRLLHAAAEGDQQVAAFWRHRDRPPALPATRPAATAEMPRVGLFSPGLGMGGAERWIVDLARHLDRSRLSVVGLGVRNLPCDGPLLARAARATAVMLGDEACEQLARNVDVLVTWGTGELPAGSPEATVYVSHGAGECAKRWAPLVAARRVKLAAVSRYAAQVFPPGSDVTIIHNGVDQERLTPRLPRETTRIRWGLKPEEIAIGYVGRLSYEKNPAAAALAAKSLGEPYRAVYVGTGAPQVVSFLKRFRPEPIILPRTEQIGDVYAALDCLVLASRTEGFSLALTEAWICGLPTVATPVGAVAELEEQFGRLTVRVPQEPSEAELADAVRQAVSAENRPVVQRARAVAQKHFTAPAMGRRWSDYLVRLFRERPAKTA